MVIRKIQWWEYILLWFKKGTWRYVTNRCYLYGVYSKDLLGNRYILEESREIIC